MFHREDNASQPTDVLHLDAAAKHLKQGGTSVQNVRRRLPGLGPSLRFLIGVPLAAALIAANADVANAHQWGSYHWNKTGSSIVIQQYSTGTWATYAEWARQDGWSKIGILYNNSSASHTDIHAFSSNLGDIGTCGTAQIVSADWDWATFGYNHITHAHSIANEYCSYLYPVEVQGVFCQEIAHGWGLDHSNTPDCMGYGYYNNNQYYYGSHNDTDFFNMYRYH